MHAEEGLVPLPMDRPIWDRFFTVAPLVIVGSKDEQGTGYNLAPKHLAMPLGWDNYYGFVCSPRHTTYHNIRRHGTFTVSCRTNHEPEPREMGAEKALLPWHASRFSAPDAHISASTVPQGWSCLNRPCFRLPFHANLAPLDAG